MSYINRVTQQEFQFDEHGLGYYWVMGENTNPPLLLIPGYTGTHNDLLHLAECLKYHFYIILPDLPGWGKSPVFNKHFTLHNYAKFLEALMHHVQIKKYNICGHCMGATLAIELAYLHQEQVQQLFLVSTPYTYGTIGFQMFRHLADLSERHRYFRRFFFLWRSRFFSIPLSFFILQFRTFQKKLRVTLSTSFKQTKQNEDVVEENWISLIRYDYSKLKYIQANIHFIHGDKDKLINKNQMFLLHRFVPNATIDIIPNAGHLPPVETPKSLASLILQYMRK